MPIWAIAITALALIGAGLGLRAWKRRGVRLVECPENRRPAGVTLTMGAGMHLATCSRWPERAGCGQECLSQIQAAPEDCQVRVILARWYHGKSCVYCGLPFGEIEWEVRKPALLDAARVGREWSEIPVEKLQETLAAALPVCFACHLANTLVREHPELTVHRPVYPAKTGR